MKKFTLLTVIIVLIAAMVLFASCAPENKPQQAPGGSSTYITPDYRLTTLKADSKVVGVRFYGLYFGRSDIAVSVDIYSSQSFVLDFELNAEDSSLSPTQLNAKQRLIELAESIHSYIVDVDKVANTLYDGNNGIAASDIYLYNAANYGETIEISKYTYDMLQIARTMYNATNGAFNPAVYRLVDLWGFSSRVFRKDGSLPYDRHWTDGSYPKPDEKFVTAFSNAEFTDFSNESVTLSDEPNDNGKYSVTKNVQPAVVDGTEYQQWLDLGGIAKGYVVDGIKDMLTGLGIARYSVDAGSSSQAYGKFYNGESFPWGVMDSYDYNPFFPPSVITKDVSDVTVSTSGQYVRRYVTDGVEYAHIIDGTLGAPAQTGVKSVTIVAPDNYFAGYGDCLTTALTVMGRDRIIDFMNGYLKEKGIKIIVIYETADAQRQILTNYDKDDLQKGDTFDNYAWAIKTEDGNLAYDFDAKAPVQTRSSTWLIITLGVIVLLAIVVVVVLYFVKGGHGKVAKNVLNAKRDKPFRIGDVGAYVVVALLIVVLFLAIFGGESKPVNVVKVIDFSDSEQGELLFVYNVSRNEWVIYDDNSNGWNVEVSEDGNDITVKFSRTVNDEERYDIMTITRGSTTTVKMIDATCADKACVYNSPAIKSSNWGIVCNPNRLKIISE